MATGAHHPHVFISYASTDRDRVLPLVDRLERAGVKTWIDRDGIYGSANYALEIAEAIEHAAALILMCSPAALASRNVRQEIALGWRFEKPYLPLLLEPVEIPKDVAYWLEASQWIEVFGRPEQDWLRDIVKALQARGIGLRRANADPYHAAMPHERPLMVGREREQAILSEHLDRMRAGQGGTVLVGGEAGIGKTTMVNDLSIQAEDSGALVLWGHAYDLSVTPPYGPWQEIFRQYGARGDASVSPSPTFIGNAEQLAKVGSQETLFVAMAEFFAVAAAHLPILLVLDDLHWADQASLDFLRFLARQIKHQRIFLVATYRSDELHRRHPLFTLVPLLVREAGASRLEVRPLDEQGHRALIRSRYDLADADLDRLKRYLAEHAEGNPLYAVELLRTLEEERVLVRADDRWVLDDLDDLWVPPLLRQVIEGRLSRLPEDTRMQLDVAAVIGQEVTLDLWASVGAADKAVLLGVVESAVTAAVLESLPDGSGVRFRHALLREALYDGVLPVRRRVWHRQIAETLSQRSNPDPDVVAYHFEQSGDERAIEWFYRAAGRATGSYAMREAVTRLETVLQLQETHGIQFAASYVLLLEMSTLLRLIDPRASLHHLEAARTAAERAGDRAFAAATLGRRGFLRWFLGDMRDGLDDLTQSAAAVDRLLEENPTALDRDVPGLTAAISPGPAGVLRRAAAANSDIWVVMGGLVGRVREALVLGAPLEESAFQQLDSADPSDLATYVEVPGRGLHHRSTLASGLGIVYALLGRVSVARRYFAYAERLSELHFDPLLPSSSITASTQLVLVHLPYEADRLTERRRLTELGEESRARAGDNLPSGLSPRWPRFTTLPLEGMWQEGRELADAVVRVHPSPWLRHHAHLVLATLSVDQGNPERALVHVREVLPDGPATEPGNALFISALSLQRLAARIALDTQDLALARTWLEAHDRWLEWSGAVLGRAEGALLWAQYHYASGDPELAGQFADQALANASDPRQPLALIAVHRFLGQLDTGQQRLDEAEQHLQQSLSLAEACAAPFERALTLLEIAKLRAGQGNVDEARSLLSEVRAICEPLEAKPTLEKVSVVEQQLVAEGGANA